MVCESHELLRGGAELIPRVRELWESLFDHHVAIGAAGLATIDRAASWPRRRARYERLFESQSHVAIWVAVDAAGEELGYALAYEDLIDEQRVIVLETLSVQAHARGRGLGAQLMTVVERVAGEWGIRREMVDVMAGNARARDLYLRSGFVPFSESWMRSRVPSGRLGVTSEGNWGLDRAFEMARDLGADLELLPGPDDTWLSSAQMASLTLGGGGEVGGAVIELCQLLEEAGVWTVFVEIKSAPQAQESRDFLSAQGFRVSTERLGRSLGR